MQFVKRWGRWMAALVAAGALLLTAWGGPTSAAAQTFADPAFQQVWQRSDRPVAEGKAGRSWTWGPAPFDARQEPYGPNGATRLVQYFDKARMEINDPNGKRTDPFFVTNGRLVVEMISGQVQTGPTSYSFITPADISIAGDTAGGDPNTPTYATLARVANIGGSGSRAPQLAPGTPERTTLDRAGNVGALDGSISTDSRSGAAVYVPETGHNVPEAFWGFLNQRGLVYDNGIYREDTVTNWVFAMGYPITEAYWIPIRVGGTAHWVLFQAFERRVLTLNPANPPAFQVEMGNVGLHYHDWRYPRATPNCPSLPVRGFGTLWAGQPAVAGSLGCVSDAHEVAIQAAIQPFEHGTMVWVSSNPLGKPTIYVLFDDNTVARFDDTWTEGQPVSHNLTPPAGRYEPIRGFGKVWYEGTGARVRERLGWATAREVGGDGARVTFYRGEMVWIGATKQILVLYEFTADGRPISYGQLFADAFGGP